MFSPVRKHFPFYIPWTAPSPLMLKAVLFIELLIPLHWLNKTKRKKREEEKKKRQNPPRERRPLCWKQESAGPRWCWPGHEPAPGEITRPLAGRRPGLHNTSASTCANAGAPELPASNMPGKTVRKRHFWRRRRRRKKNVNIFPPSLLTLPPLWGFFFPRGTRQRRRVSLPAGRPKGSFSGKWRGVDVVVWARCRHLGTRYIVVRLRVCQVQGRAASSVWMIPCAGAAASSGVTVVLSLGVHLALTGARVSSHSSVPFSFYISLAPGRGSLVGTWEGDQHTFSPHPKKKQKKNHRCFQS